MSVLRQDPNRGAGERVNETRSRRVKGARAEALAAASLVRSGWRVLGQNVRLGRDEVDIVALDPGPPRRLVLVEVRERGSRGHGLPEESLGVAKRARLRRAAARLMADEAMDLRVSRGAGLAVDLVVVEWPHGDEAGPAIRHHRDILASE